MAKKKKNLITRRQDLDEDTSVTPSNSNNSISAQLHHNDRKLTFKNQKYQEKKNQRKKLSKGLKQVIFQEKSLKVPSDSIQYTCIDAPPSFKPNKKYSDLSGFQSLYTDPQSKLRYCMIEEYQTIQTLPGDIITGYLTLRKAFTPI